MDIDVSCCSRAEFDVYRNMCENMRPEAQVFVSCNFCGKSVGYSTLASRNRRMFSSTLALKSKVSLGYSLV